MRKKSWTQLQASKIELLAQYFKISFVNMFLGRRLEKRYKNIRKPYMISLRCNKVTFTKSKKNHEHILICETQ